MKIKLSVRYLDPLALNETLRVRKYPIYNVFYRALLFEDHTSEVQQDLVPFDLQLGGLVEVGISEADAAELQVTGEDLLVLLREWSVADFIYDLKQKNFFETSVSK